MEVHDSHQRCGKFRIRGHYFQMKKTFPCAENVSRTDNNIHSETCNSPSPSFKLPMNFVHCCPMDYVYAVYLGFVRRLASIFVNRHRPLRIRPPGLNRVKYTIQLIRAYLPEDSPRKCRKITLNKQRKTTEYRQLLFYIGPIVFKGILPHERYQNFIDVFISVLDFPSSLLCFPS
ncbi:hypothetical protein CLF_102567 [Clonorchis sinensis]|uniref:Uncharacterized protein n=1 Tax=Clonorchis sinensis TaxID=79923 RepID=G7Y849_CLOSI|nr:hypothetical protein CLF_102567 [Clonorchis sinensis]